jgi:hypothetical protein
LARNRRHPLKALLVPCPDEALKMWPVNRQKIGNGRNKGAEVAQAEFTPA